MAIENQNVKTLIGKIELLEKTLEQSVRAAQRRNNAVLGLSLVSVALIGGWLYYAQQRFASDATPEVAAGMTQAYLEQYLPQAESQLEQTLKSNAPVVIAAGEDRLRALPAQFTTNVKARLDREMDAAMPQVEEQLYRSLKAGLEDSQQSIAAAGGNGNDEQRMHALAATLAATYKTETLKFIDEQYAQYSKDTSGIIGTLEYLAQNKNLSPEDKARRELIGNFLAMADEYSKDNAAK